jgi:peptide chain release factor subunit 1
MDCSSCGRKSTLTVDKVPDDVKCPNCGAQTEIKSDVDIIDDFYEVADRMGTRVELISTDSEEGEMLIAAFGGIAAILRFRTGG